MNEIKQSSKARKAPTTKAAASTTVKRTKRPVAAAPRARSARPITVEIGQELRHQMIAEAAYFLAERRGFAHGDPARDWFEAELAISQKLAAKPSAHQAR